MNKKELIEQVAKSCHRDFHEVEDVLETTYREIRYQMLNGEKVTINRFGVFSAKRTPKKVGYNFHTAESVAIEPRNVPSFKMSKTFEKEFNRLSKNLNSKY